MKRFLMLFAVVLFIAFGVPHVQSREIRCHFTTTRQLEKLSHREIRAAIDFNAIRGGSDGSELEQREARENVRKVGKSNASSEAAVGAVIVLILVGLVAAAATAGSASSGGA